MITGGFSSAVGSGFAHDSGDKDGGRGEGAGSSCMGGGTGEDMDSFRGASLPKCLAMAEGGGFDVKSGAGVDKGSCCEAEMELLSSPDWSLFFSNPLSFSSFSVSSDFFQRGPKARFNLFGPVL